MEVISYGGKENNVQSHYDGIKHANKYVISTVKLMLLVAEALDELVQTNQARKNYLSGSCHR